MFMNILLTKWKYKHTRFKKIKVQEQELTPQTRSGYTVVEWGGSKLK